MPATVHRFADFELDRSAYQLRRKGRPVQLERIPLELLFMLTEKPGQLVTREEILERIWGKQVFIETDHSINTAVRKIRQVLHDDADTPRFVVTIPSKGYRFVAPLREMPGAASSGDENAVGPPSSSMVGRGRELADLRAGLADAKAGRGRLFLISGEPGIGKTRLTAEVATLAQAEGVAVRIGHCLEGEEAVPYLPFVEILESCADRAADPRALRKLLGDEGAELSRLMPKLRRVLPQLPVPLELEAREARRHLFNSYCDFVARLASEQSALVILEDLHWADDSTLSLLDHLVKRLSKLPLLIVGTFRDADLDVSIALAKSLEDLLRGRSANRVSLKRLVPDDVAMMLSALSGKSPPAKVTTAIFEETAGNPFFVEELFLHLKEEDRIYDGAGGFRVELKIGELDAPRSVRLVVGRRLARLSEAARKYLAIAAAIGRSFSYEILAAAGATDADTLLAGVAEAERAGLIFSNDSTATARFEFSHELIRQAVLAGLTTAARQRLHLEVAEAIERLFADTLEDHVNELAYHYARSTNTHRAVEYLARAAQWAYGHSAYKEADANLQMAFPLIARLPEGQRAAHELPLRLQASLTSRVLQGFSSVEVRDAATRALELARTLDDYQSEFEAQTSLFWHYAWVGDPSRPREIAEAMVAHADTSGEPVFRVVAHRLLAVNFLYNADFEAARTHNEAAIAAYNSTDDHRDYEMRNSFVNCQTLLGGILSWLGFLDQGIAIARRGVEIARDLTGAYTLAFQLEQLGHVHQTRGEIDETLAVTDELASLVETYGLSDHAPGLMFLRGWAIARKGQVAHNIELTNQGIGLLKSVDSRLALADIALRAGDVNAGLAALDVPMHALRTKREVSEEGTTAFYFSLLKGLLLSIGENEAATREAERLFRYCIQWARQRNAKLYELQATSALARVLVRTGRRAEARAMLAEVYGWFTEGLDIAPLKDAKALLDELSA